MKVDVLWLSRYETKQVIYTIFASKDDEWL